MSTYCYYPLIQSGELSQLGTIKRAKALGFDAVEIQNLYHPDDISDEAYAEQVRNTAEECGIPLSGFTFDADLLNAFGGDTQKEVERIKHMLDLAAILGVSYIRHDCTVGPSVKERQYRGFSHYLPTLADACREITEYGQSLGIRTMIENHGFFCQDSTRVEQLVNTVAHPNFGLLTDIGNFLCADEAPEIAVGRVAPYAFYAHAKDFHVKSPSGQNPGEGFFQSRNGTFLRGAIIGHGDVPVRHCLAALKRAGFDGTIAIEFEGLEHPDVALPIGLKNLKTYWSEA